MINFFKPPETKSSLENQPVKKAITGKLYVAYLNKAMIGRAAKDTDNTCRDHESPYTSYYRSLDGESIFLVPSADDEIMYCGYDSSEYY